MGNYSIGPEENQTKPANQPELPIASGEEKIIRDDEMRLQERENILATLKQTRWKIAGEGGTAELLGMKPTTLASRMKKMNIERPT